MVFCADWYLGFLFDVGVTRHLLSQPFVMAKPNCSFYTAAL